MSHTAAPPPRRHPARRALTWLRRAVGLLLVAVVVVGMGTTGGPSPRAIPDVAPEVPDAEPVPDPSVEAGLAELLARTEALVAAASQPAAGRAAGSNPPAARTDVVASSLGTVSTVLGRHVDLLTPPAPAIVDFGSEPGGPGTDTPAHLAADLAESGNRLLSASVQEPSRRSRVLLGAGIEELLAARALARAHDGVVAEAPTSRGATVQQWRDAAGTSIATGSCGGTVSQTFPEAPKTTPKTLPRMVAEPSAAPTPAASMAADASYRLSYAYSLAAARSAGKASASAARASAAREELGALLQGLLPPECPPQRHAAYTVPTDFDADPSRALGAGEAQLAAALLDLAAAAPADLRPLVAAEAFAAAEAAAARGVRPGLT